MTSAPHRLVPPLPSIFDNDQVMQQCARLLADIMASYNTALDQLPNLLDPWTTDSRWLDWLARVTDAPGQPGWNEVNRRAAVASATALAATRGTPAALAQEAALLGWDLCLYDPGYVDTPSSPPAGPRRPVTVALALGEDTSVPPSLNHLRQIAAHHLPAHLPHELIVTNRPWPQAGITLPSLDGHPAATVFFYGFGQHAAHVIGYDLTAPAPHPGRHTLEDWWQPPQTVTAEQRRLLHSDPRAVLELPEQDGYLFLYRKQGVLLWHPRSERYESPKLTDVFPGLPEDIDTAFLIRSGKQAGLYLVKGVSCHHYARAFHPKTTTIPLTELFHKLPESLGRGGPRRLTAVIEHPDRRPGHFYLLSGSQVTCVKDFTCLPTLPVQTLWPGLPVTVSRTARYAGTLTAPPLVPLHTAFTVTYHTPRATPEVDAATTGRALILYHGHHPRAAAESGPRNPSAPPTEQHHLPTEGLSGSAPFPTKAKGQKPQGYVLARPGTHTLRFIDPRYNDDIADLAPPYVFTATLPNDDLKAAALCAVVGNATQQTPRSLLPYDHLALLCKSEAEYTKGARIDIYPEHNGGPATQEPSHSPPAPCKIVTPTFADGGATTSVPGLAPGGYRAFLVAQGGLAWLAPPLEFTLTVPTGQCGTLQAPDGREVDPTISLAYTLPHDLPNVAAATLWLYSTASAPESTVEPADTLPPRGQLTRRIPVSDPQHTGTIRLPEPPLAPGPYRAYLTAGSTGTAWLAQPRLFTITVPSEQRGTLQHTQDGVNGNAATLTYTPAAGSHLPTTFIAVYPDPHASPAVNTFRTAWGAAYCSPADSDNTVHVPFDAQKTGPGQYLAYAVGPSGGIHAPKPCRFLLHPPENTRIPLTLVRPQNAPSGIQEKPPTDTTPHLPRSEELSLLYQAGQNGEYSHSDNQIWILPAESSPPQLTDRDPAPPPESILTITAPEGKNTPSKGTGSAKNLHPGKYTAYYSAKKSAVLLSPPLHFIVDDRSGTVSLSNITGLSQSDLFTFVWNSPGGASAAVAVYYSPSNEDTYRLYDTVAVSQKQGTAHSNVRLFAGKYVLYLLGKDNCLLASPVLHTIQERSLTISIESTTQDRWTLTDASQTTSRTLEPHHQESFPARQQKANEFNLRDSFTFQHQNSKHRPCPVQWKMDADGAINFTPGDKLPDGLKFSVTAPDGEPRYNTASGAWTVERPSGKAPASKVTVHLSNDAHRALNFSLSNHLNGPLTFKTADPPLTNRKETTALPPAVPPGERKSFSCTADKSFDDMAGAVTYTYQPPGAAECNITVRWNSAADPNKPITLTITGPPHMTVAPDAHWTTN